MADTSNRRIAVFLFTTLALCTLFWVPIAAAGSHYSANSLLVLGLMWSPGIAGLVTQFAFRRTLRGLGWAWGATRYQAVAYCVPLLACLVVYGITWTTGLGRFSAEELTSRVAQELGGVELSFIASVVLLSTVGVLVNFLGALGEEIGWRGFLVPELARRWGFSRVALTSGIIWAVYHYPLMILAGYRGDNPLWYSVLFFTVMAVSMSFVFAWLRLRSGSLWTAVILHAAHNMFVQALFGGATVESSGTEYITSEFGAGMAIMYVLLGFWAWKRRGQLTAGPRVESGRTSN